MYDSMKCGLRINILIKQIMSNLALVMWIIIKVITIKKPIYRLASCRNIKILTKHVKGILHM